MPFYMLKNCQFRQNGANGYCANMTRQIIWTHQARLASINEQWPWNRHLVAMQTGFTKTMNLFNPFLERGHFQEMLNISLRSKTAKFKECKRKNSLLKPLLGRWRMTGREQKQKHFKKLKVVIPEPFLIFERDQWTPFFSHLPALQQTWYRGCSSD